MASKKTGKPSLDTFVVAVEGESASREATRKSAMMAFTAFLAWCRRNGEPPAAGTGSPSGSVPPAAATGSQIGSAAPQSFLDNGESDDDEEEDEEGGKEAPSGGPASWGYPSSFEEMTMEQVCRVVLWQRFYYYLRHTARWGWRGTATNKEYKFSVICEYARTVIGAQGFGRRATRKPWKRASSLRCWTTLQRTSMGR